MAASLRLALAKSLAAELRLREGRNLVAVGVFGSVARGEERLHSDVDVLVVVRRKRAAIRHHVRDGVLITILQQTPQESRAEVTGHRPDLNAALGGWISLRPLYDPAGLLRELAKRARHPTQAQFREAARQALIETYEDRDEDEAREMGIWYSQAAAGALLDLHERVLETGRRGFIGIRRYGAAGAAIRRLRYESLPLSEARRLAEDSWEALLTLARRKRIQLPRFAGESQGRL